MSFFCCKRREKGNEQMESLKVGETDREVFKCCRGRRVPIRENGIVFLVMACKGETTTKKLVECSSN